MGPISILAKRSWDDLETALRKVPLRGDRSIFPYQHGTITARVVGFDDVYPLSHYLLKTHLDMQHTLREHFLQEHGIDTLALPGDHCDITFRVEGEHELWRMAPPIVEVSASDGGKPVLLDGEHRFMVARELKKDIRVIWIEGIPKEYPVISLPTSWDQVRLFDQVPPEAVKRMYRFTDPGRHYFFYRDLSTIASSGIRGEGTT